MWGQVLAAVAPSVINGVFGRKQKAEAQGVDYVKLRKDAEAAGFNPLTALMAGGGSGYQREFNPALSSGAFIAEAVQRGAETYFNAVDRQREDAEAARIRGAKELDDALDYAMRSAPPRRTFGYDLTQQRPFRPARSSRPPELVVRSASAPIASPRQAVTPQRPPVNPLDQPPGYIPVRMPNGTTGSVEETIARRLDILPFDTVSMGDLEEIAGDIPSEAYGVLNVGENWDTALGSPALPGAYGRRRSDKERAFARDKYKPPRDSDGNYVPPHLRGSKYYPR